VDQSLSWRKMDSRGCEEGVGPGKKESRDAAGRGLRRGMTLGAARRDSTPHQNWVSFCSGTTFGEAVVKSLQEILESKWKQLSYHMFMRRLHYKLKRRLQRAPHPLPSASSFARPSFWLSNENPQIGDTCLVLLLCLVMECLN
jgi:hypothetical protein